MTHRRKKLATRTIFVSFVILFLCTIIFAQEKKVVKINATEWSRADHAYTISLRDMVSMPISGKRHEAAPLRVLPRRGLPPPGNTAVDTALQTVPLAAASIGNVTSFDGIGSGDFGFMPTATGAYNVYAFNYGTVQLAA